MSAPFKRLAAVLAASAVAGAVAAAQQPRIGNANLRPQPAGSPFAQSFRALVNAQVAPAWIGYSVQAVDGDRMMCCFQSSSGQTWISGDVVMTDRGSDGIAGCRLEPGQGSSASRSAGQTNAPIRLEPSDRMVVLVRAADRRIERVRIFSEDCQLDAGGRDVLWLENVRPADSIALLESFAAGAGEERRMAEGSIAAIALHADPSADAALERLVAPAHPASLRKKVTFWLGNTRKRAGLEVLKRVLRDDPSAEVKKGAVFGVSQSPEANAVDVLIATARSHSEREVRGEAIFWLGQKAGAKAASAITERIEQDPDTDVKK